MEYATLNRLLINVKKREDLLNVMLKLINKDPALEAWFCDYCLDNMDKQKLDSVEEDIRERIKSVQGLIRDAIKKQVMHAKTAREIEKLGSELLKLFSRYTFSDTFRKSISLKLTEKNAFGPYDKFNETIIKIWEKLYPDLQDRLFILKKLEKSTGYEVIVPLANLYLKYKFEDKYAELLEKATDDYPYCNVFPDLYKFYKEKGEHKKNIALLEKAVSKYVHPAERYLEMLFDIYFQLHDEENMQRLLEMAESRASYRGALAGYLYSHTNDYEKKKQYLHKWLDNAMEYNINMIVAECQKTLKKDDYDSIYPTILSQLKKLDAERYYIFLIENEEYADVSDYLVKLLCYTSTEKHLMKFNILTALFEKGADVAASVILPAVYRISQKKTRLEFNRVFDFITTFFINENASDTLKAHMETFLQLHPEIRSLINHPV